MVKFVWFPVNYFLEFSSPISDLVRLHFKGSNGVICFVYSEPHSGKQEEGEAGGHVEKISAQNEPLTTALWLFFRWPDQDDEEEFASDRKQWSTVKWCTKSFGINSESGNSTTSSSRYQYNLSSLLFFIDIFWNFRKTSNHCIRRDTTATEYLLVPANVYM